MTKMDLFLGDHEWEEAHLCSLHNKSGLDQTVFLKVRNPYGGIPEMVLLNLLMAASLVMTYLGVRTYVKYMQVKTGCCYMMRGSSERDAQGGGDISLSTTFGLEWLRLDRTWFERVYGKNAMQFLMFERYLLILLVLYLCLVCGAILPININFGELRDGNEFSSTTLANMKSSSPYLWVHVVLGWSFAPISAIVMRRFATQVLSQYHYTTQGRALVLEGLPRDLRNRTVLKKWFQLRYPWCEVSEVFLTFFTGRIHKLEKMQKLYHATLRECRPWSKILKLRGSCLCAGSGCCTARHTPALEYYNDKIEATEAHMRSQKIIALMKPLDTAFVVLRKEAMAKRILKYEMNEKIESTEFSINFAPPVDGKKNNRKVQKGAKNFKHKRYFSFRYRVEEHETFETAAMESLCHISDPTHLSYILHYPRVHYYPVRKFSSRNFSKRKTTSTNDSQRLLACCRANYCEPTLPVSSCLRRNIPRILETEYHQLQDSTAVCSLPYTSCVGSTYMQFSHAESFP